MTRVTHGEQLHFSKPHLPNLNLKNVGVYFYSSSPQRVSQLRVAVPGRCGRAVTANTDQLRNTKQKSLTLTKKLKRIFVVFQKNNKATNLWGLVSNLPQTCQRFHRHRLPRLRLGCDISVSGVSAAVGYSASLMCGRHRHRPENPARKQRCGVSSGG